MQGTLSLYGDMLVLIAPFSVLILALWVRDGGGAAMHDVLSVPSYMRAPILRLDFLMARARTGKSPSTVSLQIY